MRTLKHWTGWHNFYRSEWLCWRYHPSC